MASRIKLNTGITEHILLSEIDNSIRGGFTLLAALFALSVSERLSKEKNEAMADAIREYRYIDTEFSYGPSPIEQKKIIDGMIKRREEEDALDSEGCTEHSQDSIKEEEVGADS